MTHFPTRMVPHGDLQDLLEVTPGNPEAYVQALRDGERRIKEDSRYCRGGPDSLHLATLRNDLRKRRTEVERDLQRAIDTGDWDSFDEIDLAEVVDV